jgi:serpin B
MIFQDGLAILDNYKHDVQNLFASEVKTVDFNQPASVSKINSWVEEKTKDKIKDIIPDKTLPGVKMALINALYFKGNLFYISQSEKSTTFFYQIGLRILGIMKLNWI